MKRYIDAEQAIRLIELDSLLQYYYSKSEAIDCINATPTANVQEVRHGRWIEDKETGSLMCSECGHFTDEIIGDYTSADAEIAETLSIPKGALIHSSMNPIYCSKCGAKMDGKIKKG